MASELFKNGVLNFVLFEIRASLPLIHISGYATALFFSSQNGYTPFTRSSKHRADIEKTSSNSACILNTFARRLLDRVNGVLVVFVVVFEDGHQGQLYAGKSWSAARLKPACVAANDSRVVSSGSRSISRSSYAVMCRRWPPLPASILARRRAHTAYAKQDRGKPLKPKSHYAVFATNKVHRLFRRSRTKLQQSSRNLSQSRHNGICP